MTSAPPVRFGDKLVQIHDELRGRLGALRREGGDFLDERDRLDGAPGETPTLTHQLRQNCLEFCHLLHGHHTAEDGGVFPALEREHPELAPVLDRMRAEHVVVTDLMARIQALVADMGSGDAARLKTELDRLSGELEAHLDYEETFLVTALNRLPTLT